MVATTIDTLELARELREGGVDEKPAAAIAQAIKRGVESILAPAEIAQIKSENADTKPRLGKIETDITEIKERQIRMETGQRWQQWTLGGILALLTAVLTAVIHIAIRLP